jgi:hypothetical protein
MKKKLILAGVVILFNAIVIGANIKSGLGKGDMMLRFQERQAVTFLSALLLGLTGLTSLIFYYLKKRSKPLDKGYRFWLFSGIGFFYLCMDEYFMAHEGIDGSLAALFGLNLKEMNINLDNLVIASFGLIALAVCFKFRREIIKHRELPFFLRLGAVGLLGTVVFHSFEQVAVVWEVIEESFKFLGVSFFFAGFITALFAYINALSIAESNYGL